MIDIVTFFSETMSNSYINIAILIMATLVVFSGLAKAFHSTVIPSSMSRQVSRRSCVLSNGLMSLFQNSRLFASQSHNNLQSISDADTPISVIDRLKAKKSWDLKGLKSEVNRTYLRAFKKIEKGNERLSKARASSDPLLEEIALEVELLRIRLLDVTKLEEDIRTLKSSTDPAFAEIIARAINLEIDDQPPMKQEPNKEKKPKGKPTAPRRPFFSYKSSDGILIKVGRSAADNDQLSIRPEYRGEGGNWWLHVAGYPGSHVVIFDTSEDLPTAKRETLIDAALLAAVNSKIAQGGRISVTYTRCRNVSKPALAKDGLVYLKGDIASIKVDVNAMAARIEMLKSSKDFDLQ